MSLYVILLYNIIYHYTSLYVMINIPLYTIIYHYIPLYTIIYRYISSSMIIIHYIYTPLYIIIYIIVYIIYIYTTIYHYISFYISLYIYIYIIVYIYIYISDIFLWNPHSPMVFLGELQTTTASTAAMRRKPTLAGAEADLSEDSHGAGKAKKIVPSLRG